MNDLRRSVSNKTKASPSPEDTVIRPSDGKKYEFALAFASTLIQKSTLANQSIIEHQPGIIIPFLYSGIGQRPGAIPSAPELWTSYANDKSYRMGQEDDECAKWAAKPLHDLFNALDTKALLDLGSGTSQAFWNKIRPLLNNGSNDPTSEDSFSSTIDYYIPIDTSKGLLDQISKTANELFSKSNPSKPIVTPIHGDIYTRKQQNGTTYRLPNKSKFAVCLGSTFTNVCNGIGDSFPRDSFVSSLRMLTQQVQGGGLCISLDTTSNQIIAEQAYDNDDFKRLITSIMADAGNIINPQAIGNSGFSSLDWKYTRVVDWDKHVIHHCVSPTKDQKFKFTIEIDGQDVEFKFDVKTGDKFVNANTFKLPSGLVTEMIEEIKWTPVTPIHFLNRPDAGMSWFPMLDATA